MEFDFFTLALVALLAVFVIYSWRSGRKRKAALAEQQAAIKPGVEIMTSFGLFGTLVSIDELTNVAEVETSPGTVVRVHRQTVTKVVTPEDSSEPRSVEEAMARANAEAEAAEKAEELKNSKAVPAVEAEAVDGVVAAPKKPVRRTAKKTGE
jgi:preprotein translocase subunit YajC